MAQFYAEIQGNRGKASRMGTKNSGMWAHIRGWDVGVKIECWYDEENGEDVIDILRTNGSNNPTATRHIARLREKNEDVYDYHND